VDRINQLKSLVAFMSEATKELIWMNQREEPEVSRDWSCTDLDVEDLQAHGEVCRTEEGGVRSVNMSLRIVFLLISEP